MVMDIVAWAIQATIIWAMATLEDESVELAITIDGEVVEWAINLVSMLA